MPGKVKPSRVLVVGRFQPPHMGHVELIRYALSVADEVIVVIGSAQESHTLRNPLTAGERFVLIETIVRERFPEEYSNGRVKIVPVMDINMNKVWVQYLRLLLPDFEGVVTRNPLVEELFRDMGLKVYRQPLLDREKCEGTRIRNLVVEGAEWRDCIPPEILGLLEEFDFEGRLRRLSRKDA